MTELERRAMLGDKQAQKECTRRGIVLSCPFCGGEAVVKTQKQDYGISGTVVKCNQCLSSVYCLDERAYINENGLRNVPIENHKFIAIHRWNTRPAPPIGRCGECTYSCNSGDNITYCEMFNKDMLPDDYCSQFEPMEVNNHERLHQD